MPSRSASTHSRRFALGALSLGAADLVLPGQVQVVVRAIIQRGVFGGGQLATADGAVQFSLSASRLAFAAEQPDVVLGRLVWVDEGTGQRFVSTAVTDYQDLPTVRATTQVRIVRGTVQGDAGTTVPFRLTVIDGGLPGEGVDSVALVVGAAALTDEAAPAVAGAQTGISYAVAGPLVAGDVQAIDLTLE